MSVTNVSLSVVITFRNGAATLPATLRSLDRAMEAVPSANVEWVLVNNGSTDESAALAAAFCASHQNSRGITEPVAGVSNARNAGLAVATGDFISWVDSDDEVAPDFLLSILQAAAKNPDLIVMPLRGSAGGYNAERIACAPQEVLAALSGWWCWQFVCRRTLWKGVSFNGECYEDFGLFPRILQASQNTTILSGTHYHYRDNPASVTKRDAVWRLMQLETAGSRLLEDSVLTDPALLKRVRSDLLRGRMQLRAVAGFWPVLPLRDAATLIALSPSGWLGQSRTLCRLSLSVLRRRCFGKISHVPNP